MVPDTATPGETSTAVVLMLIGPTIIVCPINKFYKSICIIHSS